MKFLEGLFFGSWFTVACSLETFFEGKGNMAVVITATVVALVSAWAISRKERRTNENYRRNRKRSLRV